MNINSTYELNNGIKIPVIGFGTWTLKGKTAQQAVNWALEIGYRLIDTASFYKNESDIGIALAQNDIPREEIFITSKVWDSEQGYNDTFKAFERSLKKLNLKYLDLYLIHWPRDPFLDTWKAMEELYQKGKIRTIGVSNFTVEHLRTLLEHSEITPTVNQVEFHPFLYQRDLLEFCKAHNIRLEAYSPLTKGRKLSHPLLQKLSKKYKKTPAQILLRWGIEHGIIEIPRSSNKMHIAENIKVFDFTLDSSDMDQLNNLSEDFRAVDDPIF
jgi:diketogulonate reductase-like aldo/keto reductase